MPLRRATSAMSNNPILTSTWLEVAEWPRLDDGHKDNLMNDHISKPAGWSGAQGHVWADLQLMLDRLFMPFERLLVDAVAKEGAHRVLDIGCGAGATSLAIARHMDGQGHCTGLDIAEPLVDVARRRAQLGARPMSAFSVPMRSAMPSHPRTMTPSSRASA
jgi:SAM-dependent methyltransferase